MSEVWLTIRDGQRVKSGRVERELARAVVAALTAEPETLDELEVALGRYRAPLGGESALKILRDVDCDEPWDEGLVMLDLPSRVLVAAVSGEPLVRSGVIECHDDTSGRRLKVPFWLPDDWLIVTSRETWGLTVAQRRAHRTAPPFDSRAVLYGKVCEYLVHELRAARMRLESDPVIDVHARWLLTAREDLQGSSPRELLLERREEIDHDIESRCWQWTVQGECPVVLPLESQAFRYGGYGSHEVSLYHDLVRYLTIEGWRGERPVGQRDVAAEVAHLESLRRAWLETSDWEDLHGLSPQQVIDMERSRRPWALTGEQMIIDHDCPMCRMLAEQSGGPTFVHLDPLNSDQHFAFSTFDSLAEWEHDQQRWAEFDRVHGAAAMPSSGAAVPTAVCDAPANLSPERFSPANYSPEHLPGPGTSSIWKSSGCNLPVILQTGGAMKVGLLMFGLAAHLTELAENVRSGAGGEDELAQFVIDFDDLRAAIANRGRWLVDSLITRCVLALDALEEQRRDIKLKCRDLRGKFEVLRDLCAETHVDPEAS